MDRTTPPDNTEPLSDYQRLQRQRFRSITLACMLVTALLGLQFGLMSLWPQLCMELLALTVLTLCLWLHRRGQQQAAINTMIATMGCTVLGFLLFGEGVHDFAFTGFPAILIIGSMLMKQRAFLWTLAGIVLGSSLLVWLEVNGYKQIDIPPAGLDSIFDIVLILGLTAFATWLLASDMRGALQSANRETAEAQAAREELRHLIDHDPLTNLPNRLLAGARVEQAIASARRHHNRVGVLFIDLDNFKSVNDSLGHATGDKLLKSIAQRLQQATRDSDTVCRLGGDEFLIVTPELRDSSDIHNIIDKLTALIERPFIVDGQEITTSMSIGVAIAPDNGEDFDSLHQNADIAMYQAKNAGRSTYRFFDQSMHADAAGLLDIRNGLSHALANNEFSLHYQPKIRLSDGELTGVEALLRWHNETLGHVSPVDFVPVAEASGLIIPIGEWVMREACRQLKAWQDAGLGSFNVAVNVSSVQFSRSDVCGLIDEVLQQSGLAKKYLEVEITESVVLDDSENAVQTAARLRNQGIKISIDDFGTGYSSLSYLQQLSIDTLKVDRSFIHNITSDAENATITSAIIQLASGLGIKTIAEGVEDLDTQELLKEKGCDEIQGYYISRPLPANEFVDWYDRRKLVEFEV